MNGSAQASSNVTLRGCGRCPRHQKSTYEKGWARSPSALPGLRCRLALRACEMHGLLNVSAGDIAEARRVVVELVGDEGVGEGAKNAVRVKDAVVTHDQMDLGTERIQQTRSPCRVRGVAEREMAREGAVRPDDVAGDVLDRSHHL